MCLVETWLIQAELLFLINYHLIETFMIIRVNFTAQEVSLFFENKTKMMFNSTTVPSPLENAIIYCNNIVMVCFYKKTDIALRIIQTGGQSTFGTRRPNNENYVHVYVTSECSGRFEIVKTFTVCSILVFYIKTRCLLWQGDLKVKTKSNITHKCSFFFLFFLNRQTLRNKCETYFGLSKNRPCG